jgi:hypothetical protein
MAWMSLCRPALWKVLSFLYFLSFFLYSSHPLPRQIDTMSMVTLPELISWPVLMEVGENQFEGNVVTSQWDNFIDILNIYLGRFHVGQCYQTFN